jgi:tetratricopeptide (TPR) repeat protein
MGQSGWEQAYALGRRLASKGDVARAEQAFLAAIAEAERAPDGSLELATTLSALAQIKFQARAYEEAESLFRRVIPLREAALGPEHPLVVSAMNNLAAVFVSRDALSEAEPILERAVAATRKRLQAAQFDLTANINNLVRLYVKRGDFARAEPLILQLLLMKRPLGPAHPDVAAILVSLAKIRNAMGRTDDAERILRRVLAARERALPSDDPRLIATREDIARLRQTAPPIPLAPVAAKRARGTPDNPMRVIETPPKPLEMPPRTRTRPVLDLPATPTFSSFAGQPTPESMGSVRLTPALTALGHLGLESSASDQITPNPTDAPTLVVAAPLGLQSLADAIQPEPEPELTPELAAETERAFAAPTLPELLVQMPADTATEVITEWEAVALVPEPLVPEPLVPEPLVPEPLVPVLAASMTDMATEWETVPLAESRPADGWLDPAAGPLSAPPPELPPLERVTPESDIGPGWGAEAQPRLRRDPEDGGRRRRAITAPPKRAVSAVGIALAVAACLAAVAGTAIVVRPSLIESLHGAVPVRSLRAVAGRRQIPLAVAPPSPSGREGGSAPRMTPAPAPARPPDATPTVAPSAPAPAELHPAPPTHPKAQKPAHAAQRAPTAAPDGAIQVPDGTLIVPPMPTVPSGTDDAAQKPNDSAAKSGSPSFPPSP